MREALAQMIKDSRQDLTDYIRPRDGWERAVISALGEISWDEAVEGIQKYRAELASPPSQHETDGEPTGEQRE